MGPMEQTGSLLTATAGALCEERGNHKRRSMRKSRSISQLDWMKRSILPFSNRRFCTAAIIWQFLPNRFTVSVYDVSGLQMCTCKCNRALCFGHGILLPPLQMKSPSSPGTLPYANVSATLPVIRRWMQQYI